MKRRTISWRRVPEPTVHHRNRPVRRKIGVHNDNDTILERSNTHIALLLPPDHSVSITALAKISTRKFCKRRSVVKRSFSRRIPICIAALILLLNVGLHHYHIYTAAFLPAPQQRHTELCRQFLLSSSHTTIRRPTTSPAFLSPTTLFGIKGFRQWFEQQFPSAVKSINVAKYHDTFDHVLVDMNQILHVVMRRTRTEEQGVKLLMYELDVLIQRVKPTQSLVLAIDGSPAAAKLATQRKRRFSILKNTQFKLRHLDKLRGSKRLRAKRLRNYQSELQSLQLTPGTDCMKRLESAILYWAWQRLQSQGRPNSKLMPGVRIYLSTSQVPGEGEIKLLEWIHNFRGSLSKNPGQSVALIGGDADLLLEAMVLPPAWTHNVFVLRPDEGGSPATTSSGDKNQQKGRRRHKDYMLCTSLWDMTLSLDSHCRSIFPDKYYNPEVLLQIRNDLVLLLIMNGNDYLPGLVATNFRNLFRCYMTLLEQWVVKHESLDGAGLVDPNLLAFRLPFCIEFFRVIGQGAPSAKELYIAVQNSTRRTYQSVLNDMVAIGFIPGPVKYSFFAGQQLKGIHNLPPFAEDSEECEEVEGGPFEDSNDIEMNAYETEKRGVDYDEGDDDYENDDDDEEEEDDNDNDDAFAPEVDVPSDEVMLVRLSVGRKENGDFMMYQTWAGPSTQAVREAKGRLAKNVLERCSLLQYWDEQVKLDQMDYDWEIEKPAESRVDRYLAGMLWTLQTYQDGVCPSYGYNYGKCVAPTGRSIEEYLNRALEEKRKVGAEELLKHYKFGGSIKAGVACLAALPTAVKNLVPEPYRQIDSGTIEKIYAQCMDPIDNFFQLEKFDRMVDEEISRITNDDYQPSFTKEDFGKQLSGGRRILLGDHYWSVLRRARNPLQHPFQPPPPPAESFAPLAASDRIKVSRIISMDWPRPRPGWDSGNFENSTRSKDGATGYFHESWLSKHNVEVDHMDFGSLLDSRHESLQDIPYKTAFRDAPTDETQKKDSFKVLESATLDTSSMLSSSPNLQELNGTSDAPYEKLSTTISLKNLDGQNSMVIIKQLSDIGIIGNYTFDETLSGSGGGAVEEMTIFVFGGTLKQKRINYSRVPAKGEPKKATREHLASLALNFVIRHRLLQKDSARYKSTSPRDYIKWHEVNFRDLKLLITNAEVHQPTFSIVNPENATAWMILKQLADIGIVGSFDLLEEEPDASRDIYLTKMTLCVNPGEFAMWQHHDETKLSYSYHLLRGEPQGSTRHLLASQALDGILKTHRKFRLNSSTKVTQDEDKGETLLWPGLTFGEIKEQLLSQPSKS